LWVTVGGNEGQALGFRHGGDWMREGMGGGETGEISSIRSWGIEDEISSILYPLPGAVCFGLI